MFEKYLRKIDILSKNLNVTLLQMFFKHFASNYQLPSLSVSGTLVENELNKYEYFCTQFFVEPF